MASEDEFAGLAATLPGLPRSGHVLTGNYARISRAAGRRRPRLAAAAFGKAGGLYIAGASTKTLLMITVGGLLRLSAGPDGFYP